MITSDHATRPEPACGPDDTGLPRLTALGLVLLGDTTPGVLGASFTVRAGETVALVGHPGSGRTALLRAVAGLVTPDSGVVSICGVPLPDHGGPDGDAFPARLVSTWDLLLASRHGAAPGLHGETCSCVGVLVADEPTSGMPRAHRARVWHALDAARRAGHAVLVALRPDDAFDAHYDRAYLLTAGRTQPLTAAPVQLVPA